MKPSLPGRFAFVLLCALGFPDPHAHGQGVSGGSITGGVSDAQDRPVPGATVLAVHDPSGRLVLCDGLARGL
jgi:hypothetical protein